MAFRINRANKEMVRRVGNQGPKLKDGEDEVDWLFKLYEHHATGHKNRRSREINGYGTIKTNALFMTPTLILAVPGPGRRYNGEDDPSKPLMFDKGTQTYESEDPCPLCDRENRRPDDYLEVFGDDRPSYTPPADPNAPTRDIAIEAPDRGFYSSDQLTYFQFGNFLYRGWTYRTLDGRIEHVPKYPRGIPLDEIRVEKPLRTPAQF